MEKNFMLTTTDNPFDPFNDFKAWYMFDCEKGHNTSARLARIANIDDEMTQKEVDDEMDRAMDLIVKYDLEDKYIKVEEEQTEIAEKATEVEEKQTATATNA